MTDRAAQIAALRLPLDQLPDPLPIPIIQKPFDVTIRPPGSKSITNRALLLAALADGTSELRGPLIDADDAQVMLRAIQQLGATVRTLSASEGSPTLQVTGVNGQWKIPPGQTITLNLHNAGTATRFLTAAAILTPPDSGGIILDGDARMRERPIGELVGFLTDLGVRCQYLGRTGFPPLRIHPPSELDTLGAEITVPTTASSQFVSALMLIAPFLAGGLVLTLRTPITSRAYIGITSTVLATTRAWPNAHSEWTESSETFRIPSLGSRPSLHAFSMEIEPDASGATYFVAAIALSQGSRLSFGPWKFWNTAQPDAGIGSLLARAGALRGDADESWRFASIRGLGHFQAFDADLSDMPDGAMTLAVAACFASPTPTNPAATSTLRGLRTLRVKETDRLAALQTELTKLGAKVEIFQDGDDESLRITPPATADSPLSTAPLHFDTYNDHRMAMSLALVGLRRPNVFIRNPACVAKTYPTFWQDLSRLYA